MFVWINDDRRDVAETIEGCARLGHQVRNQREIAAVRGIGVNAEVVALAQIEDCRERIDGTRGRRPPGPDTGPPPPRGGPTPHPRTIHPAPPVPRNPSA